MDQFRVLKVWSFKEWDRIPTEDRPRDAVLLGTYGWVLLEGIPPVPLADGIPLPEPLEPTLEVEPESGPRLSKMETSDMAKHAEWKLSLADVMALVAATAVGVWVSVMALTQDGGYLIGTRGNFAGTPVWYGPASKGTAWVLMVWPCVGAWTFAIPVLCLFRRRDRRRRLFRRPGVAACTTVAVASPGVFVWDAMFAISQGTLSPDVAISLFFAALQKEAGLFVIATWVLIALGGRWRAEPSWVDRTGRVLGVLWVAVGLTNFVYVNYLF